MERGINPFRAATLKNVGRGSNLGNIFTSQLKEDWSFDHIATNQLTWRVCLMNFGRSFCNFLVRKLQQSFCPTFPDEAAEGRFGREFQSDEVLIVCWVLFGFYELGMDSDARPYTRHICFHANDDLTPVAIHRILDPSKEDDPFR